MPELVLTIWVYFAACGFEADMGGLPSGQGAITTEAPNIAGYWVQKSFVMGVVDWRRSPGKQCTSLYSIGAPHIIHVGGTTKEVLEKLRE